MGTHPGDCVLATVADSQHGLANSPERVYVEHSEKPSLGEPSSIPSFPPSESRKD